MRNASRLSHLDILKGVAILMVIWGHVLYFGMETYMDNAIYVMIYSLHMPLFALLAGYLSSQPLDFSARGIYTYWSKKATRLLLPLLAIPMLYNWIWHGFSTALPLNMYLGRYWFTYALFLVFALFYLYRWLLHHVRGGWAVEIGLGLAFVLAIEYFNALLGEHHPDWQNRLLTWQVARLYKYFWLGYLMARYPKIQAYMTHEASATIAFIGYSALLYAQVECGYKLLEEIPLTLLGLVFFYSLGLKLATSSSRGIRLLGDLGRESLPIYLTHYFFIFNLSFLPTLLSPIPRAYALGWEVFIGAVATVIILLPTLLVIRVIKSNRYLTLLIYGEASRKDKGA